MNKIEKKIRELTDNFVVSNTKFYARVSGGHIGMACRAAGIAEIFPMGDVYANMFNKSSECYTAEKYFLFDCDETCLSLTWTLFPSNRHWHIALTHSCTRSGGAGYGDIDVDTMPQKYSGMADAVELIALFNRYHLANISPDMCSMEPMYAVANGYYWYGGTEYQERDNGALASTLAITPDEVSGIPDGMTQEAFAAYIERYRGMWKADYERICELWQKFGMYTNMEVKKNDQNA